jgi:hypothetical protein
LSLSVAISPDIRSPSCYGYEPKFTLETNEFTFTSETYDIPQTVAIVVNNLNASQYEGAFSASFQHSIVTEDVTFNSAFLRPVPVTLRDDSSCPHGASLYDDSSDHVRKCGYNAGFYVGFVDPLFCDSVTSCVPCPLGLECGFNQDRLFATWEGCYNSAGDPSTEPCRDYGSHNGVLDASTGEPFDFLLFIAGTALGIAVAIIFFGVRVVLKNKTRKGSPAVSVSVVPKEPEPSMTTGAQSPPFSHASRSH